MNDSDRPNPNMDTDRHSSGWLAASPLLRRGLWVCGCLLALIVLVYVEENWRGRNAWLNYQKEWEAKGEKFDLASMAPRAIADDQNLAMAPIFKPLFQYRQDSNQVQWLDTNGMERLRDINVQKSMDRQANNSLALGVLDKGTFTDLEACREFYRGNTNYPQPSTPGTAAQDILTALSKYDSEMKEVSDAAAARPYCRFPLDYDTERPFDMLLPHLASMKQMALLLQMRVIARLELGQTPEAFNDLKLGLRLGDSFRAEPLLISHLVRVAMLTINLQGLREGLIRRAWSDGQLVELQKYFAATDLLSEYKVAMRGERAACVAALDHIAKKGFRFDSSEWFGNDSSGGFSDQFIRFMPRGWIYQNMVTISRLHQDYTLPLVDEQAHRLYPDRIGESEKVVEEIVCKKYNPCTLFVGLLFPALGNASVKFVRMQAYVDAAGVACALERYRRANGQLPETLEALVPRFLDKLPMDVVDGQPLRFHKTPEGGYVVYSVGWNQTDEGGEPGWTQGTSRNVDGRKGDWAWSMPKEK